MLFALTALGLNMSSCVAINQHPGTFPLELGLFQGLWSFGVFWFVIQYHTDP